QEFAVTEAEDEPESLVDIVKAKALAVVTAAAKIRALINRGANFLSSIQSTAEFWSGYVKGIGQQVSNLKSVMKNINNKGKYERQSSGEQSAVDIAQATQSRAKIDEAALKLSESASPEELTDGAVALLEAVEDAVTDSDAIFVFEQLARVDDDSVTGQLIRQLAVIAMVRAAIDYQPASHNDAQNTLNRVCDALDAEIIAVGDAGEDELYQALTALRHSVTTNLTRKGADLARLQNYNFNRAMPSLVLAQRLYHDSGRETELTQEVKPIHPAFMPANFEALNR
ncbi:MAG: hypothetical protein ACRC5A_08450, partial [Enterobacteriaceae bacterium]